MNLSLDVRARPLLVIALICLAAAAAGLLVLQRARSSDEASPAPATTAAKVQHARSTPAVATPVAPSKPAAKPKPKAAAKPKPAVTPSNLLPARIRQALSEDRVVVVALYNPKAKIDGTALAEAKDGTKDTDAAFVPIDVRKKSVDSLTARYGAIQDPSILVLRPSGELFVRIDGFADRDTVAQAAANAES